MVNKNILITGIGGFLGRNLCDYLHKSGYNIIGVGRIDSTILNNIRLYNLSLPHREFKKILKKHSPDVIIHCAGTSSVSDSLIYPYKDFNNTTNVCGFVLESIRTSCPNCKFIYLSSAAVYGNPISLPINEIDHCRPISPYGYHKRLCELLIEEYSSLFNIDTVIFRVFSAYGEGLKKQVIYDLCEKLTNDKEYIEVYGNGLESRDFIHVLDICRAIEMSINKEFKGIFNLATGHETSISNLVKILRKVLKIDKDIKYIGNLRSGDPDNWKADITKLSINGFKPLIPLEEGVKRYCKWYTGRKI